MSQELAHAVDFAADAEQLRQSMQTRPSPDMAKGALMVLYGCDGVTAFAELLRVAQQAGVPMIEVAAALVHLVNHDAVVLDGDGNLCWDAEEEDGEIASVDPQAVAAAWREWGPALRRAKVAASVGLHGLPRGAQRLADAAEYLTERLTPRALTSLGAGLLRPHDDRAEQQASA